MDIRERLTANANDFDAIITDVLAENERLATELAEAQKDAERFNLYHDEEHVGTFYQGSFSTEQKAIEFRDHLVTEMKDLGWVISEFSIEIQAIDQAINKDKVES